MNIIKLKDIVMPSECRLSPFFNSELKGKYAYWIKMRYIFPLNSLDFRTYIRYEQMDESVFLETNTLPFIDLYGEDRNMFNFAQDFVDHEATETANAINEYRISNDYIADPDIDVNKLRKFRSWLASEILSFNTGIDGNYLDNLNANEIHMLEYYANDMYNDTVKYLNIFGNDNTFTVTTNTNKCCCNSNVYDILNTTTSCNALSIYTKHLHNMMVLTFEDVNFWLRFNKNFIITLRRYIDNIIKTGMIVSKSKSESIYIKCNCNEGAANAMNIILNNLSEALEYIIEDDVKNHTNFIHDALYNWAEQLYDYMSWEIK
jgi:hypothetical protein